MKHKYDTKVELQAWEMNVIINGLWCIIDKKERAMDICMDEEQEEYLWKSINNIYRLQDKIKTALKYLGESVDYEV